MNHWIRVSLATVLMVGTCAAASAQSLADLVGAFKKEVQRAARNKVEEAVVNAVEEGCQGISDTAEVSSVSHESPESYVVEDASGRLFQLRSLEMVGLIVDNPNMNMFNLLQASRVINFSEVQRTPVSARYRVHLTYADFVSSSPENGLVKSLLGTALNNTLQDRLPSEFVYENARLAGIALDGRQWCVPARLIRIRAIHHLK